MNDYTQSLSNENRKIFFKLKNIILKIVKAVSAVDFNKNCLREGLCPRSINSRHTGSRRRITTTLEKRLQDALQRLTLANEEKDTLWGTFAPEQEDTRSTADALLAEYQHHQQWISNIRIQKKLTSLHRGPIRNERPAQGFMNLSTTTLSKPQEKLLNLGLNCHYIRRPHPEEKRIEIECLIDKLLTLKNENKVTLSSTIREELIGEAGRSRGHFKSQILNQELKTAARELREREDIIIRKGDKAAVYVIMDKESYLSKMDEILQDTRKFQRLQKDPTENVKKRINNLIKKANSNSAFFSTVIGDYRPGYCYGTVKTHKPGNPLRPIISQVTTPTYQVAKKLNAILTPYVPTCRSVQSATEFIDLLHTAPPCNNIASLDVESLFTNVPVDETIDIIIKRVYHSNQPALDIPEDVLRSLLHTCTKEAPFLSHRGELYRQIDGVAMGSPLGVLFANIYMAAVEEKTFQDNPPSGIYARYIDDIFVTTNTDNEVTTMISALQSNSCLRFTSEHSLEGRLPFLDIDIKKEGGNFSTKVFTKATNIGRCLNARGECPATYKKSVVASYVNRALTHCSTWAETHKELDRVRQLLTNNGYPDRLIEEVIRQKLDKYAAPAQKNIQERHTIVIYHQNTFHEKYKEECNAIQSIIKRGVFPLTENADIKLRIYCKPNLTRSLVMRNSTAPRLPKEATTNVVYRFTCPESCCDSSRSYIGRTSTTLRRRLQYHRNQGSIFQHYTEAHNMRPPLQKLIEGTSILHREANFRKLQIAEAVAITYQRPSINVQQFAEFILPSVRPMVPNHQQQQEGNNRAFSMSQAVTNQRPQRMTRAANRESDLSANENARISTRQSTLTGDWPI